MELKGRAIVAGSASGPLLVLDRPLSFWGGVDPETGRIIDPRHPQHGSELKDRILVMEGTVGSSSSSAVMLELLRNHVSPAGIVLGQTDAILVLGVLVARELGLDTIPVLESTDLDVHHWESGTEAVLSDGVLRTKVGSPNEKERSA